MMLQLDLITEKYLINYILKILRNIEVNSVKIRLLEQESGRDIYLIKNIEIEKFSIALLNLSNKKKINN